MPILYGWKPTVILIFTFFYDHLLTTMDLMNTQVGYLDAVVSLLPLPGWGSHSGSDTINFPRVAHT